VGEFFWKVVRDGHMKAFPPDATRQGVYAATPDGDLLASLNPSSAQRLLEMLSAALANWRQRPPSAPDLAPAAGLDEQYRRVPPERGLVLNVFSRIPLENAGDGWNPNRVTGRDHAWLTEAEWRALLPPVWRNGVRYPLPQSLVERLARFHLVDNVRGEPDIWQRDQIRAAEVFLVVEDAAAHRIRLEGNTRAEAPADPQPMTAPIGGRLRPDRGYDARLQGYLVYDPAKKCLSRCDLLAWGEAWGHGHYTPRPPEGRFPLLIAFSLAGNRPADRIQPQGIRNREDYFGRRGG
jgi:hypothetical protein